MQVKFEDKIGVFIDNFLFIFLIVIIIFALFIGYVSDSKIGYKIIPFTIFIIIGFIFFTRRSSKIVFSPKHCIIYAAPFLKHKYNIEDIIIIVKLNKLITIKINEPIYRMPFYSILFKRYTKEEFFKYIKERKDIKVIYKS